MAWNWDEDEDVLVRLVTISGVGAGIGFGTCGISALLAQSRFGFFRYIALAGSVLFFVSVAVLLLSGAGVVVRAIVRSFKR